MNKYSFPGGSTYNTDSRKRLETTIFYYGLVVSNNDKVEANRIKVRIKGIDDSIASNELSFAFPMIQKYLNIIPKVGETVLIFIPDIKNPFIDRLYIGPIISQPQMLNGDTEPFSAKSVLSSGIKEPKEAPSTIPENKGVYPGIEDISLQGRNNSDIILKDKELLFRAGQFNSNLIDGEIPKFNKINPSYIQIKHDAIVDNNKIGVINLVSNKINLITHKNGNPRFILNNQDDYITSKELNKILKEAHPLVFGDKLLEYLKLLKDALLNHVHPYPGLKPQDLAGASTISKYNNYPLANMLSKNIKIN